MSAAQSSTPGVSPAAASIAQTDLAQMLAGLQVDVREGEYVYATTTDARSSLRELALATVTENEGLTCVLRRADADAHGLNYDFIAAWLTLRVHSALEAVGLTAAFSRVLTQRGIACNVLAGFYHDHLLVPADRRDEAVAALHSLRDEASV